MFDVATDYFLKHEQLKKIIAKRESFCEAVQLALDLHAMTHFSEISGCNKTTYEDEIWEDTPVTNFCIMPKRRKFTLAWHIWHITRIEDIVGNIIINESDQVFTADWQKRMNATAVDTGNSMTDAEVMAFSAQLVISELKNYRITVGRKTRDLLRDLTPESMKKKASETSLHRIMSEGCLTEQKGSQWLLDFWGKKTVGGLVLLPLTRHHIMHLDACRALKEML